MPEVMLVLQKDMDHEEKKTICLDFAGLIRNLIIRFPPKTAYAAKYNAIKLILLVNF